MQKPARLLKSTIAGVVPFQTAATHEVEPEASWIISAGTQAA